MGEKLLKLVFLSLALLFLQQVSSQNDAFDNVIDDCAAGLRLNLRLLSPENHSEAKCADGVSMGGYYISVNDTEVQSEFENPENRSFVIWLGESAICSGQSCIDLCEGSEREAKGVGVCKGVGELQAFDEDLDQAKARCLASRAQCTSSWWDTFSSVTAATMLCEADKFFGQFKRVFIPSCSLDYWLGNEDSSTIPPGSFSDSLYRGNVIFEAVIDELIVNENLTFAEKIVLGGTRGGGIGALHLASSLRKILRTTIQNSADPTLPIPQIYILVDSSWIVSVEKFAATQDDRSVESTLFSLETAYKTNSSEWIERAQLLPSCTSKFPVEERFRCLFPSEIVKFHLNNVDNNDEEPNRALIIQSEYDLFQLQDLGIIDPNAVNEFEDQASFAQGAFNFIENYGQQLRNSVDLAARSIGDGNVGFFTPACGQHGYIVPTRVHNIEPRVEALGKSGSIQFQRNEAAWKSIFLGEKTVRDSIVDFVQNDALQETNIDPCGEFLCDSQCLTQIFPFAITPLVSLCVQQLVLVYAFFVLFVLIFFFTMSYLQSRRWRKICANFWKITKTIDHDQISDSKLKYQIVEKKSKQDGTEADQELELLKMLAVQQNQTADEVQEQLIIETNAESEYRRVHFMVQNLSYWAAPRKRSLRAKFSCNPAHASGKQIIRNVSAAFEPGKVHALMGPSGSGKTTFLELLSLSKTTGRISGTRFINGVSVNAKVGSFMKTWLKHNQSYVSQQDSFFPELTVREHLEHCAWLVLPEYMPDETKLNRVWQVIRLMDLSTCADTICGDGGVNYEGGISGGQRRRLSVATQLLNNPCALFLDEPTSGLDSVSALNLVRRLQVFAKKAGVNVIMTIHQPRREIYQDLDRLYILVKGTLIFSGPVTATGEFFSLQMDNPRLNVGNELLDILKDKNRHDDPAIVDFVNKFEQSDQYKALQEEIKNEKTYLTPELASEIRETLVFNSLAEGRHSWRSPSSVFWLQWVLISRTIRRGGFNLKTTMFLSIIAGLVLGGLFYQADSYASKTGLSYLMVSTLTFLQGVFLARRYFDEKDMFDYEKKSGTMRSWQAFLYSQFSRDAVTSVLESLSFAIPAYILGGFALEVGRGVNFIVIAMLIGYATTSQNVLIQIDRNNVRSAATIQIGLLALGALFNGFIVSLGDLPEYYAWIPYVMLNFYGFVGVIVNEFASFTLPCDLGVLECAARTGDVVLQTLEYDHLDVFICALALLILVLLTRTCGVINFYYRYARGNQLKKVGSDGKTYVKEAQPVEPVEIHATGQTIKHVIEAQKSSRFVQNASDKDQKPEDSVKDPARPTKPVTQLEELMSGMQPKGIPSGETSGNDTALRKGASKKNVKHFDEYDDDDSLYDHDEHDDDDGEEEEPDVERGGLSAFLLSRQALLILFLVDLASAGYICGFSDDTRHLIVAVSCFVLFLYGLQYFYQLGYLLPYTLENNYRDFVWAAEVDGPSFILLIIDIVLVFLQFGVSDDLGIRQIMTLTIRVVRLIRVQLFFVKGSKAHRIRAESFLAAKNKIVMEYITKLNEEAEIDAGKVQRRPQERHSRRNWLASLNVYDVRKRPTSQGKGNGPRRPARPQRPNRPRGLSFGRNRTSGKFSTSQSSGARRRGLSTGHNPLLEHQMARYQNAGGITKKNSLRSGRRPPSSSHSATRPNRPTSGAVSRRNIYTAANGWIKYKNDKTGELIYYNKYTGKWVYAKDVESGRLL